MLPAQREVQSELARFVRVSTCHGLLLFLSDLAMYMALIAGVLFLPWLWMKVIASALAGFKIANLVTIAHDAAHNSLTRSRTLNKIIAVVSFLPALFNYRLWIYDHHRLHHSRTNENHPDSYTPFSKEKFDSLPYFRRMRERLYRRPSLLFFGLYYILERWRKVKLYPCRNVPREFRASAWRHFGLIAVYFASFMALLIHAPLYSGTDALTALVLGFAVPFYVFQSLYAFTVYVQHTHPLVPWFNTAPDRGGDGRQEYISVHLVFPGWFNFLVHNVYHHGAHHVCPAIPCYRLGEAQARLNELLGGHAISQRFTFAWLFDTMKTCKLYDYDNHRWLDFDGRPTTGPTLVSERVSEKERQARIADVMGWKSAA